MTSSINSAGGGFNSAALKQMQAKMFNTADKNGDGVISREELSQVSSAKGSQTGQNVNDMFAQLDSNSDGAINRLESDAGIAKLARQMQKREADGNPASGLKDQVFKTADQNGDGSISKDELSRLLSNSTNSGTTADELMTALDANQDGSISKSESDAAVDKAGQQMKPQGPPPPPPPASGGSSASSGSTSLATVYDPMDTNKDGKVSVSELLAALSSDNSSSGSDSSSSSAADGTKSGNSALFAAAIKSYVQAGMNSYSQASNTSLLSSSALYA